jgi:hypothetical protein
MKIKVRLLIVLLSAVLIGGIFASIAFAEACCWKNCCCGTQDGFKLTSYGCACTNDGVVLAKFCKFEPLQ